MFDTLKRLFVSEPAEPHPEIDPHVAASALLVEAALADGIYADCEENRIRRILAEAFGMDAAKAARVLEQAESLAETAIDHHRFTKVVKACLDKQERIALLEQLWLVALADGEKSPFEDAFIRRIAPLLAVEDRERTFARSRAEARIRPS
ncbi:TerB family tellurite resistance protein [Maricaulis sp.]|uniref:tellurite resistance TerB family protein n=1 Tax=Maricaulis sp. TaxID=1486257 RepID=UPI002603BAC9|nr:TerB family tellurite resistance protein [Maricaulis sp.]